MAEYHAQQTPQTVGAGEPFYAEPQAIPFREVDPAVESVGIVKVGAWEAGLCNCFSSCVPNCCMATCLPCISVAQIAARVGMAKYTTVLLVSVIAYAGANICMSIAYSMYPRLVLVRSTNDDLFGRSMHTQGVYVRAEFSGGYYFFSCLASLCNLAWFIGLWQLRSKVRQMFQLPGGCCEDFCVSLCCSCCSVAQLATHVKSYAPGNCDFGAPDVLPGYAIPSNDATGTQV